MALTDSAADTPPLRDSHDRRRVAVSSTEAARRLRRSRYFVAEQVKAGLLPGYGIPSAQRTRWFVYVDAIQVRQAQPPVVTAAAPAAELSTLLSTASQFLLSTRRSLQREREATDDALRIALEALGTWNDDLIETPIGSDGEQTIDALREALLEAHLRRDNGRAAVDRSMLDLEDAVAAAARHVVET